MMLTRSRKYRSTSPVIVGMAKDRNSMSRLLWAGTQQVLLDVPPHVRRVLVAAGLDTVWR